MDYGTFFSTNIASVAVYAVWLSVVAWNNRRITGVQWFAGSLIVDLLRLILQSLEGRAPQVLSGMAANELSLVATAMQFVGLYWFVMRKPLSRIGPMVTLGLTMPLYALVYLRDYRYSTDLVTVPVIVTCLASVWLLLRRGRRAVSKVTAAVLLLEVAVLGYRAILTDLFYARPWVAIQEHGDPRWLYSLEVMAILSTCMVMCYLWYLVTELGQELSILAVTDPLTGAMNRRALEETGRREVARSVRHRRPLCLIVFDVDDFKRINDKYGHAAGDSVLTTLVSELKPMLRSNDLIARTGGEEFSILLPDTSLAAGLVTAGRIRAAVERKTIHFEQKAMSVTVSAGVAQLQSGPEAWQAMLRSADRAMYEAKREGRNQVRAAGASAHPATSESHALATLQDG